MVFVPFGGPKYLPKTFEAASQASKAANQASKAARQASEAEVRPARPLRSERDGVET